jgi:hypothetical protein
MLAFGELLNPSAEFVNWNSALDFVDHQGVIQRDLRPDPCALI